MADNANKYHWSSQGAVVAGGRFISNPNLLLQFHQHYHWIQLNQFAPSIKYHIKNCPFQSQIRKTFNQTPFSNPRFLTSFNCSFHFTPQKHTLHTVVRIMQNSQTKTTSKLASFTVSQIGQCPKSPSQDLQQQRCLQGKKTTHNLPAWHNLQQPFIIFSLQGSSEDESQNDTASSSSSMTCFNLLLRSETMASFSVAFFSHALASISAPFNESWSSLDLFLAMANSSSFCSIRALILDSYLCIISACSRVSSCRISLLNLLLCSRFWMNMDISNKSIKPICMHS